MKCAILQIICKDSKNIQRVGSNVLRRLVKNVKIVSVKILKIINIFQTTCI